MKDEKEVEQAQERARMQGPLSGEVYRHYKGGRYVVLHCGVLEATIEPCVMYRSLEKGYVWVRTLEDWSASLIVDGKKVCRFFQEE